MRTWTCLGHDMSNWLIECRKVTIRRPCFKNMDHCVKIMLLCNEGMVMFCLAVAFVGMVYLPVKESWLLHFKISTGSCKIYMHDICVGGNMI